eukprot:TRINITY_DN2426_c0_g1_i1.p1 TRINITY_DN2426_c0_g1~~TRINITY_DN2426_c0_g1_i1.p1  ORF type:complete len:239 (-),score=28.65 TRINITY_DN2426_c0_g1_i1:80-796(-)
MASPKKPDCSYEPIPVSSQFVATLTLIHVSVYILAGFGVHFLWPQYPWWRVLAAGYTTNVLAILTHWSGHIRWNLPPLRAWYKEHTDHHVVAYPPSRFLSDNYTSAKKDNTTAYYPTLFGVPFLLNAVFARWTVGSFLVHGLPGLLLLLFADHLHEGLHVKGFYMERWGWFWKLRALHYYHHKGHWRHNYAMADFLVDWICFGVVLDWKYNTPDGKPRKVCASPDDVDVSDQVHTDTK